MPVNSIHTRFWYQSGGLIRTSHFNMIPGDIRVTAGSSLTAGEGAQAPRIVSASSASAGDESFGEWYEWRSSLFRQGLRLLTVGMATGEDQDAQGLFTLFIF
jgi:hypothetical protein